MPGRNSMRRIKESLRLHCEAGLSQTEISRSLNLGRSTVQEYLRRFESLQLSWPNISGLSDAEFEVLFYPQKPAALCRKSIDYVYLNRELRRTGVTLQLLWQEYRKEQTDGYGYSQFCWLYRAWQKGLKPYLRQSYKGGDIVFIDYSGKKAQIVDRKTGEIKPMELFVLVWGASNFIYAEAQVSQGLENWIMGHVRGFEYGGCVPHKAVPDNLKSGVDKACYYDPDINHTYQQLSEHYGFAVLPARPRRPKDKAKVEVAVQIVQRWILARLRNRIFHTIEALNAAIRQLLEEVNTRVMKRLGMSRKALFEQVDKPNARSLPDQPFVFQEWLRKSISTDHHVDIFKHYYSVPTVFYKNRSVDVRVSATIVEIFGSNKERLATHARSHKPYGYTTNPDHMPERQKSLACLEPAKCIEKARHIGPNTEKLVTAILTSKPFPQQGIRPSFGIFRLGHDFGYEALEKAAEVAVAYHFLRVNQVRDVLRSRLYERWRQTEERSTVINTDNVRGQDYFSGRAAV